MTPKEWGGRGLTGMNIIAYDNCFTSFRNYAPLALITAVASDSPGEEAGFSVRD